MTWNGDERRHDMVGLEAEVRALSVRFDNELGSANGGSEGSVKRHLRKIQDDMSEMKSVIVGDGNTLGIGGKVINFGNSMKNYGDRLQEHIVQDRWLFGLLFTIELGILLKLYSL